MAANIAQVVLGGLRVRTRCADNGAGARLHRASCSSRMASATVLMSSKFWYHASDSRFWATGSSARLAATLRLCSFCAVDDRAQMRHITGNATPQYFMGFVHLHLTLAATIVLLSFFLWARPRGVRATHAAWRHWSSLIVLVQVALGIGTWL